MIALIQRVSSARVEVDAAAGTQIIGAIGPGVLAFIGVERDDAEREAERLMERVLGYRVFSDPAGKMNLSLTDIGGGLLLVPQFTLAADTDQGTRASFSTAAPPAAGSRLFDHAVAMARARHPTLATGRFGAHMRVHLINDGPVTFTLRVPPPTAQR